MTKYFNNQEDKSKIFIGLSGGVDSSVAALKLKEEGHDVVGVHMQNWETNPDDPHCSQTVDLNDARAICDQIDIPLERVNFTDEYWNNVFQHCLDEFAQGRTPNPDIWCNREIKFKTLLSYALERGAHFLATGHYARIIRRENHCELWRGLDPNKDQSYFLYALNQHQLTASLFPLGEQCKGDVRKYALQYGLITHAKKDSTGICFIGERKFKDFLSEFLLAQPGNMETPAGKIIGQHAGIMFYTIGQRKGLNIGGKRDAEDSPWYVVGKDVKRNVLIVGQGHDHPLLFSDNLTCKSVHWINQPPPDTHFSCRAQTRYRQQDQACEVNKIDDGYLVKFQEPQRAVTPGQSIVFYQDEQCLGGGIIEHA